MYLVERFVSIMRLLITVCVVSKLQDYRTMCWRLKTGEMFHSSGTPLCLFVETRCHTLVG